MSLSRARLIQPTTSHHISSRYICILSSTLSLGLASSLFVSDFPTIILHEFTFPPIHITQHAYLILLHLITRRISGTEHKLLIFSFCDFL